MSDQDIHIATQNGDISRLILINDGTSLDVRGRNDFTPLHYAAQNGHSGAVQVLVDAKASLDIQDSDGLTPMHYAARAGAGRRQGQYRCQG